MRFTKTYFCVPLFLPFALSFLLYTNPKEMTKKTPTETELQPMELRDFCNVDPLDHCAYIGSSDEYHHFQRTNGLNSYRYKIKKSSLHLDLVFPLAADKRYVIFTEMIDKGVTPEWALDAD